MKANMMTNMYIMYITYSFPHNHGSGKWLCLKGNCYWRDPCLTSMIMGGRAKNQHFLLAFFRITYHHQYVQVLEMEVLTPKLGTLPKFNI